MPVKDEVGNRYGRVVVVERVENDRHDNVRWLCKCDCGEAIFALGVSLRKGKVPACNCELINLVGLTFGRLLVLKEVGRSGRNGRVRKWLCRCSCGKELAVAQGQIIIGHTKSCGCFAKERTSEVKFKHGLSSHPLYVVWVDMKKRCYERTHKSFEKYNSKGIEVCSDWLNDVETFIKWCLANGWARRLHLDRRDNSKGYSPENCRFVTPEINIHNSDINHRNKVGYAGIWFDATRQKFESAVSSRRIQCGVKVHLGRFDTLKEAVEARNKFIIENNLPHRIQVYEETSD